MALLTAKFRKLDTELNQQPVKLLQDGNDVVRGAVEVYGEIY